jgi:hypothetical protein
MPSLPPWLGAVLVRVQPGHDYMPVLRTSGGRSMSALTFLLIAIGIAVVAGLAGALAVALCSSGNYERGRAAGRAEERRAVAAEARQILTGYGAEVGQIIAQLVGELDPQPASPEVLAEQRRRSRS